MYATLRIYEMASDWDDDLTRQIDEGFLPALKELPGFVSYQALAAGPRVFASVTVLTDRAATAASDRLAARFVQQHAADRFPSPPEITSGEVRTSAGVVLAPQ
jgi:hypothetical protein